MSRTDLEHKELTAPDVIHRAFQEQHLGAEASPERVKEWLEWRFPAVCLEANYRAQIKAERKRFLGEVT